MATIRKAYVPTHPGEAEAYGIKDYHVPPGDVVGGGMAAYRVGELLEKNTFPIIGGGLAYAAGAWTVVTGGTGDAQADASTAGGGLLITAASDDNFDTTLTSVAGITPATGQVVTMAARIQVSDANGIGFYLGLATGGADAALPFGTEYTDVVAIRKAITSTDPTGRSRGNSGTAVSSAALGTMADNTEITIGFWIVLDSAAPYGYWTYEGVQTPLGATEVAQVLALLTTPQTMHAVIHVTGVTGTNPTLTVTSFLLEVDN